MKKLLTCILGQKDILLYFIASLLACFAFHQVIDSYGAYVIFMAVEGIVGVIGYYAYERIMLRKGSKPSGLVPIILIGVYAMQCIYVIAGEMINCYFTADMVQWIFTGILFVGIMVSLFGILRLQHKEKITPEQTVSAVIFVAFLFQLLYAQFTGAANISRQNDTIQFVAGGGHLGYIWHVWAYGTLPQVDPRTMWEFSQPPLYYLLSGYWCKISSLLGVNLLKVAENIQFLSVFCVTLTTIYVDKIMVRMKLSAQKRIWGVLLMSCIPYTTYLSGAVNNDVLLALLTVMSFYYALKWYEEPKLTTLLADAVLTGLLVMSKSSGALVAPAILVLWIMRFIKDKDMRLRRVGEYLLFGVISLPLGLWWNVRNMIRFDMPFLYVNEPSTDSVQYIPDYTLWERLFDVKNQLNHPCIDLFNTSPNVDHNIIISTVKTLVFTQSVEMMKTPVTRFWGMAALVMTILLLVVMIACGIVGLHKISVGKHFKLSWLVLCISYLAFYLHFNLQYPFVHTMHARYILPVIFLNIPWMICGMDFLWKNMKQRLPKSYKWIKGIFAAYAIGYFGVVQCFIMEIMIQAGEWV